MSLYRKYRPKAFADVVGQDHIVNTLENAVMQNKLSHAYLFAGSRGTGKTSVARILAKAMLTQGIGEADEKLGRQICEAVDDGSLVDLTEIDGASNRGIDDIRNLVEKIQFSPVAAKAKVFVLDEVHMLTKEAFNALLKTLEEPPPYAFFILATTQLQKIPATIQSRCQRFAFRQVPEEDIIRRLQFIADQEKIAVDRSALRTIAHHAEGGMRDAISLLDQLRSLPKITLEDVQERIGESGHEYVEQLLAALELGDQSAVIALVQKMENAGVSLENVTRLLLTEIRKHLHEAVEQKQPLNRLSQILSGLLMALRDMRIAPVPGLVLESALIALCESESPSPDAPRSILRKAVSAKITEAKEAREGPEPTADSSPKETVSAEIEAPVVSMHSVRQAWPQILKDVSPAAIRMSLKNGHVHAVSASKVTVAFASAFHKDKVAKTDAARAVEQVMETIFRRQLKLECVLEEEQNGTGTDKDMVNLAEAASEVF